jgi:hypothetical protein
LCKDLKYGSEDSICIIKTLFERTISKKGISFKSSYVKQKEYIQCSQYITYGCYTDSNTPTLELNYICDGVEIYYKARSYYYNDDIDKFKDYYVKLNGKFLLNEKYQ